MKIRLGELLIEEKLLTASQLEEGLRNQVLYGGRLGTNLLELGFLKEEDIARVLSKKLGVPTIEPEELDHAVFTILQLIPARVAEKYSVIPIRLENNRLILAMADPSNFTAIDEIAFNTGYIVQPVVAPELHIVKALDRYYSIQPKERFVRSLADKNKGIAATPPSLPEDDELWDIPESSTEAATPSKKPAPTGEKQVPPAEPARQELQPEEEPEEIEPYTLGSVAEQLAECGDREEIADILVEYLGGEFDCCALFLLRNDNAYGWKACVGGRPVPGFDTLCVPLDEPSILKTIHDSHSYYLGPVPRAPFNSLLLKELGNRVPSAVLLAPLIVHGRLIGTLFVTSEREVDEKWILELQQLNIKAAMAFEVLILKSKIRMM